MQINLQDKCGIVAGLQTLAPHLTAFAADQTGCVDPKTRIAARRECNAGGDEAPKEGLVRMVRRSA